LLTTTEQAVLDAVDERAVVELLRDLVRARSVSPPEGTEAEAARVVAGHLSRAGIAARLDEVAPGRPNVLAELGGGEEPTLLWNAHLDTVPAGSRDAWQSDPFGAEIRDGRLYGRGASDCKGGVAAMAAAAVALSRAARLRGRLVLCFVMGEETGHLGARAALQRGLRADLAVVGEWSGAGRIAVGYRGGIFMALETRGRVAHGSRPMRGRNAIDLMTEQVLPRLKTTPMRFERHPAFMIQEPTWNVGTIAGGVATNVVADHCRATVDLRLVPGQDPEAVLASLRDRVSGLAYPDGEPAAVDLSVISMIGPFVTPGEHPVVATLGSSIGDVLGVTAEHFGKTGVADANVFAHEGRIPAVAYGPGNPSGHEPNEYCELSELVRCTRVLAVSALRACGTALERPS
jgi:acetylornithine deacetylase/succinyl-diaminopimelate desuccinylase family protein